MELLPVLVLNGLVWGLIVALIALGLSIIFGLLDFINVAHGDFFMVGAVMAWVLIDQTGNFWIAFAIVPMIGLIAGSLIERAVLRPIENNASLSIVASFGLSLILQEGVRATYGATPKRILDPIGITFPMASFEYEVYRLFAAGVSVIAIAGFFVFLQFSRQVLHFRPGGGEIVLHHPDLVANRFQFSRFALCIVHLRMGVPPDWRSQHEGDQ